MAARCIPDPVPELLALRLSLDKELGQIESFLDNHIELASNNPAFLTNNYLDQLIHILEDYFETTLPDLDDKLADLTECMTIFRHQPFLNFTQVWSPTEVNPWKAGSKDLVDKSQTTIDSLRELNGHIDIVKRRFILESEMHKEALKPAKVKSAMAVVAGIGFGVLSSLVMLTPAGLISSCAAAVVISSGALISTADHVHHKNLHVKKKKAAEDLGKQMDFSDSIDESLTEIKRRLCKVASDLQGSKLETASAENTNNSLRDQGDWYRDAMERAARIDADCKMISRYGYEIKVLRDRTTELRTRVQLMQRRIQRRKSRSDNEKSTVNAM